MRPVRIPLFAALLAAVLAACGQPPATPGQPSGDGAASLGPSQAGPTPSETAAASPDPAPTEPAWRLVSAEVDGITPREDHTWTLDPEARVAYLFGGRTADNVALDDLWAYDLDDGSWRRIDPPRRTPPARFGHNAAWVEGIGLVVFAGQAGTAFFDDLWAFDPAAERWRRLASGGDAPVARYGSCAALGPDGRLWISHGFTAENRRFADTRAYDFGSGTWSNETPAGDVPVARCLHGCWWTDDGRLALFAGQTTGVLGLDDLWLLTPGPRQGTHEWNPVGVEPLIEARNLYAAAAWGSANVIFGGQAVDGSRLADAYLLSPDGRSTRISVEVDRPGPRSGAELVADSSAQRVLLFGGRDGRRAMSDLWELTLP